MSTINSFCSVCEKSNLLSYITYFIIFFVSSENYMISVNDLRKLSKSRFKDAEILFKNKRYNGCIYLCGYVIEIALKARICKTLKWIGFPESKKEFENFKSFKVHSLDVLLSLSGIENNIRLKYLSLWTIISSWGPEMRYSIIKVNRKTANDTLYAAKNLIKVI